MTWIKTVDDSEVKGVIQDIYRQHEWGTGGRIDYFTKSLGLSPSILRGVTELLNTIEDAVGRKRLELISTIVSNINRCKY